jgi:hypothetical protein
MASRSNRSLFHLFASAFVALILLGALTLTVSALLENRRFSQASNQIFWLINQARSAAVDQKNFAMASGEDIWADLTVLGRIGSAPRHPNPWDGDIRATSVTGGMRVETDLPVQDCRRLALLFLEKPSDFGLLGVEAQSYNDSKWALVYPLQGTALTSPRAAELACGTVPYARLALIFKIR